MQLRDVELLRRTGMKRSVTTIEGWSNSTPTFLLVLIVQLLYLKKLKRGNPMQVAALVMALNHWIPLIMTLPMKGNALLILEHSQGFRECTYAMIEVKAKSFKNDIPFLVSILDPTISWYFTLYFWLEVRYELKNPSSFPGVSAKEMKEMKHRKVELLQWKIVLRGLTVEMMILFFCFILEIGKPGSTAIMRSIISLNGNKLEWDSLLFGKLCFLS